MMAPWLADHPTVLLNLRPGEPIARINDSPINMADAGFDQPLDILVWIPLR